MKLETQTDILIREYIMLICTSTRVHDIHAEKNNNVVQSILEWQNRQKCNSIAAILPIDKLIEVVYWIIDERRM